MKDHAPWVSARSRRQHRRETAVWVLVVLGLILTAFKW
jgi:hypothetical protein